MKRFFGRVEVVFDMAYLLAAAIIGVVLLVTAEASTARIIAGAMALVLVCGDAFHLIPRIQAVLTGREEALCKRLGRGKQITSITMTAFYLLLWQLGKLLFHFSNEAFWTAALFLLAAIRIVLCLLPQNRWTDQHPPVRWGILRNLPFFLIGIIVAGGFFLHRGEADSLQWLWLAVLLSFACYLPVVVWADRIPKLGMLMLPKTCMYLWMLVMFFSI